MKQGSTATRRRTPIEDAYDQFRLERQGNRLSPRTLAPDARVLRLPRRAGHAAEPARPAPRRSSVLPDPTPSVPRVRVAVSMATGSPAASAKPSAGGIGA